MSNLIIDIGNSRVKIAIYQKFNLLASFSTNTINLHDLGLFIESYPDLQKAIISSVRENDPVLVSKLKKRIKNVIELDQNTKLPLVNLYETPETLGKDRIASAVGAQHLCPGEDLLVIDAGTAITYDHVSKNGEYHGGFITPGLQMRFKALNHFTSKLPLLEPEPPREFSGLNTFESMKGGIQYGLEGEISRITQYFFPSNQQFNIILTGGDTNYFEKLIKSYKFVAPELTLLGLNKILEFNHP